MIHLVLSGMALASAAGAAPVDAAPIHRATVQHQSVSVDASYQLGWKTSTRQVAATPAGRQGMGQCHWRADAIVTRAVKGADNAPIAALSKPIHQFETVSGVETGNCAAAAPRIEASLARRARAMEAEAATAARSDHPALAAELQGLSALAPRS
ncbi:MAG: hypothetical protein DI547_11220 [Sphingobium sp.]|nr:MAG: hypothetical protein DI547_11220 [Sphingobium sp.]